MQDNVYKRGDSKFESALDKLHKEYKGCAGGPEAEVIVNWNKAEASELKTVSFYATNKELATAIERGRDAIVEVHVHGRGSGATLHFEQKRVRPLATVIRPRRQKTQSNLPTN
jgi:hypothetical protein